MKKMLRVLSVAMLVFSLSLSLSLGAAASDGSGMGAVPADVGLHMGPVQFQIGHACVFGGGPRPWLRGEARHWDSGGALHTRAFWHQQGYEWAYFGLQRVGASRGDARITLGVHPCNACWTGLVTYTVNSGINLPVYMTMRRR